MTEQETLEFIKCAKDPVYFMETYGYIFDIRKNNIGKLEMFGYQKDILRDYQKHRNNICLKSRQCVPENTFVDTPNGPKSIQNFKEGDLVYSYNLESNQIEMDSVKEAWYSGEKQCVKFKLKDSRNVEVGENHPFWIVNKQKWVMAKNIEIGDEILDANIGFGEIDTNEDEIKLLSYLITDGCTNKQVKFTNNNLYYLSEFENSINNIFPELKVRKGEKNNGFDYYPHQKHGVSTINPVMEWCESKGIANKKTEFKNLPEEVFYWNKKSISLLINRIFARDGWISILKKTSNKRMELGLGSPSIIFLEQVKSLLKKYNIKGNIYEVKNMKLQKNKFYKLRITHSKSILTFINEIGIYKKIKPEHLEIIKNRKHDVKNTSIVRKITKTEIKKCFDISVTKNENFLINGLLVHNTGISVITSGYVAWRMLFNINERIIIIANDGRGARRFLASVKQILDYLPAFLLPDEILTNNTQEIKFSNGSFTKAVASGKQAGRGETATLIVIDEMAFVENMEDIWMGASLALSSKDSKCIMISTPAGVSNLYYSMWTAAQKGETDFHPIEVHWKDHPVYSNGIEQRLDEHGKKYLWSPWYEVQCENLHWDKIKIAQELDLSFEGSAAVVIENWIIEKHEKELLDNKVVCYYDYREEKIEKRFTERPTGFHVWEKPVDGFNYIIGADVGRGDGADYSTIQVLNADTLNQAAEYQGKISPDLFAQIIYNVGMDYNIAYVAVECNSFGLATTLTLKKQLKYDYLKMHHSKSVKKVFVRHAGVDFVDTDEEIPGFQTTSKTRPLVISTIIRCMREGIVKINSKRLLQEFKTFIYYKDKAQASLSFHDDLIFSYGIALFLRETEFENVFTSKELYKAMLNTISSSRSAPLKELNVQPEGEKNTQRTNAPIKSNNVQNNEDENDINWLFGTV